MSSGEKKPRRSLAVRLMLISVIVIAFAGTLGFFVMTFGSVKGSEFAPEQFARREFFYYRLPIIKVQITPVVRWTEPNDLEDRLTKKNAILTKKPVPSRWDIVSMWAGSSTQTGDAAILCHYLDTTDKNGDLKWLKWTDDDVQRATPFWKTVRRAAEMEAYYLIPELFDLAGRFDDAQILTREVDTFMARECESVGDDYMGLGNHERAGEFYAAAAKHDHENETLERKRTDAERKRQPNS